MSRKNYTMEYESAMLVQCIILQLGTFERDFRVRTLIPRVKTKILRRRMRE